MPQVILTAEISHFVINQETGVKTYVTTDYQIDSDNEISLVQSWTDDFKPFPISSINMVDFRNDVREQNGWV